MIIHNKIKDTEINKNKQLIPLFEVPLNNKDINKEKESKIQLVLKQLNLDSNLLSPRNKNKLISTISKKLNFLNRNETYLQIMSLYTTIINKNNNIENSIDKHINTFISQVLYFNIINKLYYLSKYSQKRKFNKKSKRFESINKNIILRKIKNINDSKVLSFTHNLITRGQILDLSLKYLILNLKIDILKLKVTEISLRNKNMELNLSSDIITNNISLNSKISNGFNGLLTHDKNNNETIRRSKGDLIFIQNNNLILTPLQTLNILNTLNTVNDLNNINNINNNNIKNEKFNSILLKISKSQNINNNSLLNSRNNSVIIPKNEIPNLNISDYKLYNNNSILNNKESFIDLQLSSTKVASFFTTSKTMNTPNYFFKDNFIKLQETIKDLILKSNKEFNVINDTVKFDPNLSISNLSILDYIKSITKQKDIKLNYSQIIGYKFNTEIHKMIKNIYEILASFFIAINCIISKPRFIISNDKIIIKLFFYNIKKKNNKFKKMLNILNYKLNNIKKQNFVLIKNLRNKIIENNSSISSPINNNSKYYVEKENNFINLKNYSFLYNKNHNYYSFARTHLKFVKFKNEEILVFNKTFLNKNYLKLKKISEIISKFFKKPLELNLIRVYYPYNDSNIFVNFLALNIKRMKMKMVIKKLLKKAVFKNSHNYKSSYVLNNIQSLQSITGLNNKTDDFNANAFQNIPAVLSGFKIKIAGRLMSKVLIPRKTVTNTIKGTVSKNKIQFLDRARFTSKNKRGAYSITVHFGQNLQS